MSLEVHGELLPVGGGDAIPLIRTTMTVGRRESCDICLRFPNVSGRHCELIFQDGYWYMRDLGSTNGTKVNGQRITNKLLRPGDEITIAKRRYNIRYNLPLGKNALEDILEEEDITSQSLLEKAGLVKPRRDRGDHGRVSPGGTRRVDDDDDDDDDD